ncbi:MAG: coth protein-domain-containing protein [Monoraphidium minutum]|nr:MAG: coth protein-domain-containing protein [Monoraphidium minutum]
MGRLPFAVLALAVALAALAPGPCRAAPAGEPSPAAAAAAAAAAPSRRTLLQAARMEPGAARKPLASAPTAPASAAGFTALAAAAAAAAINGGAAPAAPAPAAAAAEPNEKRVPAAARPTCCAALPPGFPHELPVVIIDTGGATLPPDQSRVPATLCTCGAPGGLDYSVPIRTRIRGSSSAVQQEQKSLAFGVRMPGNLTENGEIEFMGFPEHEDFILYAPEGDASLGLRNWLAYNAARRTGRYASRTRYAELFLVQDGRPLSRDHYWGVYIAGESVERGRHRVDVKRFDRAQGLSGGWLLKYENDNSKADDPFFELRASRLTILVDYPGSATQEDLVYIKGFMDEFEAVLLGGNATTLSQYLDLGAAVDYFLGTELIKNPDGYRRAALVLRVAGNIATPPLKGSIKFSKDRDGPIVMGPMWDYDEAFGACCGYPIEGYQSFGASNGSSGGSAISPEGWRFNICNDPGRCRVEPLDGVSQWYRRLWLEPWFRAAAAARWAELRAGALADAWFLGEIAQVRGLVAPASDRYFQRWAAALSGRFDARFAPSWRPQWDAATAELQARAPRGRPPFASLGRRDWTLRRLAWMDGAFAKQAVPGAGPDAYLQPLPPGAAAAAAFASSAGPANETAGAANATAGGFNATADAGAAFSGEAPPPGDGTAGGDGAAAALAVALLAAGVSAARAGPKQAGGTLAFDTAPALALAKAAGWGAKGTGGVQLQPPGCPGGCKGFTQSSGEERTNEAYVKGLARAAFEPTNAGASKGSPAPFLLVQLRNRGARVPADAGAQVVNITADFTPVVGDAEKFSLTFGVMWTPGNGTAPNVAGLFSLVHPLPVASFTAFGVPHRFRVTGLGVNELAFATGVEGKRLWWSKDGPDAAAAGYGAVLVPEEKCKWTLEVIGALEVA